MSEYNANLKNVNKVKFNSLQCKLFVRLKIL